MIVTKFTDPRVWPATARHLRGDDLLPRMFGETALLMYEAECRRLDRRRK
jgi:hypothetical protein